MNKTKFVRGIQHVVNAVIVSRICFLGEHTHVESHRYPIDFERWTFERCEHRAKRAALLMQLDVLRQNAYYYEQNRILNQRPRTT